jgi:glycosyltransferase involved in cell wall biosynthesis
MKLRYILSRAKRWLLHVGAPEGSLRRRLLRCGDRLFRQQVLHQVLLGDGRWVRFAWRALDVYRSKSLNRLLKNIGAPPLTWSPQSAEAGELGAARLVLGLLQQRADVRQRFPRALTGGENGAYCTWVCTTAARQLGLSGRAVAHVRAAFARQLSHRIWLLFDHAPNLFQEFPLALTPAGQRPFLRWLVSGVQHNLNLLDEEIWWFLFECAEDPARGVAATYLRNAQWQERFPLGLTVFGRRDLFAWIRTHYRSGRHVPGRVDLSGLYHPVDEVRLLYRATPALQHLAPRAFLDPEDSQRLVGWLRQNGRHRYRLDDAWWAQLELGMAQGLAGRPAVNVLGHFCYPSGLREALHNEVGALHQAGVRTSCRDVPGIPNRDLPGRSRYLGSELFDVTLVNLYPEPFMAVCYPRSGLAPRPGTYRIAVWYWELEEFPQEWTRHAASIHEIWAPTRFIARAMRGTMPVPVIEMLPGVQLGPVPALPRARLGLPEDRYLFLFMFDMSSIMERKNPLAVIRAFQRAFRPGDRAALVIKVIRGSVDPDGWQRLSTAAADAGVLLVDRLMSREESYDWINTCDCYVSLHRSEGFGLTMAEAMLLGKPVIATGYSGNLDFMSPTNSLLVDYRMVPITQELPWYRKGCRWADADIDHAAERMRWVYEHAEEARALGTRARQETSRLLSLPAAGQRMLERLEAIRRGKAGTAAA